MSSLLRDDAPAAETFLTWFPSPVAQMEASREPLHRGASRHHQPLELAPGPHLRPGVPHPPADGHLPADPRQQGRSLIGARAQQSCSFPCAALPL